MLVRGRGGGGGAAAAAAAAGAAAATTSPLPLSLAPRLAAALQQQQQQQPQMSVGCFSNRVSCSECHAGAAAAARSRRGHRSLLLPPAASSSSSSGGGGWPGFGGSGSPQPPSASFQPPPPPQPPAVTPPPPPPADPMAAALDPQAGGLTGLLMAYAMQLQQSMEAAAAGAGGSPGANVLVRDLCFHPPGSEAPLLSGVSFQLKPNQLGLVIGRSGSGKTTLLQLLAGLSEQTGGDVFLHRARPGDHASGLLLPTRLEQRMQQVGLVFQFPERHFLGDDLMQEMTFAWPRDPAHWAQRQALAVRLQRVVDAVGLSSVPFDIPPAALSGGQQRRLALALQLVRAPALLLLDEPLAGLDWRARREVVALLAELKKECTLLVVSHDLADVAPLVDCAWRMQMGGRLDPVAWPPDSLSDVED